MRGYWLIAIALLVCVLACTGCADSGTSTGNPAPLDAGDRGVDGDSAGELANGGYCEAGEMTPLELDEDSPLGFAMTDVLAYAEGTHEEAIRWNPQDGLTLSPESGEGTVTIIVTASGTPRFVEPKEPEAGNTLIDLESSCASWLEIDVEVTVETSGGALDESFDGVLRAQNPMTASIYKTLDPTKLGGNFMVEITGSGLEGFTLEDLYFAARFSQYGAGGELRGLLERRSADSDGVAAGAGAQPFAEFGSGTCGDNADGFTVGLDDAIEGVTVQDALDVFNADDEVDITWETGAMTTSSFAFAADSAGGCVLLDNEQVGDLTLLADGTITMASADGRLDAAWPGRIEAHVADGAITRVQFMLSEKLPSHTMPGANALYGFPMDEITTFDAAGVGADIAVTEDGVEGTVSLTGYVFADCETPPDQPGDQDPSTPSDPEPSGMGVGGCRGADPVTIASGTLE